MRRSIKVVYVIFSFKRSKLVGQLQGRSGLSRKRIHWLTFPISNSLQLLVGWPGRLGVARPAIVQGSTFPHVHQGWSRGGKPLRISFPRLWSNEPRDVIDRRAGSDPPAFASAVSLCPTSQQEGGRNPAVLSLDSDYRAWCTWGDRGHSPRDIEWKCRRDC